MAPDHPSLNVRFLSWGGISMKPSASKRYSEIAGGADSHNIACLLQSRCASRGKSHILGRFATKGLPRVQAIRVEQAKIPVKQWGVFWAMLCFLTRRSGKPCWRRAPAKLNHLRSTYGKPMIQCRQ